MPPPTSPCILQSHQSPLPVVSLPPHTLCDCHTPSSELSCCILIECPNYLSELHYTHSPAPHTTPLALTCIPCLLYTSILIMPFHLVKPHTLVELISMNFMGYDTQTKLHNIYIDYINKTHTNIQHMKHLEGDTDTFLGWIRRLGINPLRYTKRYRFLLLIILWGTALQLVIITLLEYTLSHPP